MSSNTSGYACIAFKMKSVKDACEHMQNFEIVEHYGDGSNGKFFFVGDEGKRYLAKCSRCGGFFLVQKSEWHGIEDDYYTDFFPVSGAEEAHELNLKYDGYEIEMHFPKRYMMSDDFQLSWSNHAEIDEDDRPSP